MPRVASVDQCNNIIGCHDSAKAELQKPLLGLVEVTSPRLGSDPYSPAIRTMWCI